MQKVYFRGVGVQVPSLVSKHVKGLAGGVEQLPCACLYKCGNCFWCMHARIIELTA